MGKIKKGTVMQDENQDYYIIIPNGQKLLFPCMNVRLVPIEKVKPNEYNPNRMMVKHSRYLSLSIKEDGVTMPVVGYHDQETDTYWIVDGENRYKDLLKKKSPVVPVAVIHKTLAERRISTIRHNKAKGAHQLDLEKQNFQALIAEGSYTLAQLSEKLALEPEEIVILTKAASIIEEFKNQKFSNAWERDKNSKIMYKGKDLDEYGEDE